MTKHIKCTIKHYAPNTQGSWDHGTRFQIAEMLDILNKFQTEEGFEEYCENDITINLGEEDSAHMPFCPRSWDGVWFFLHYSICHLIVDSELDTRFPYYAELLEQMRSELEADHKQHNYSSDNTYCEFA